MTDRLNPLTLWGAWSRTWKKYIQAHAHMCAYTHVQFTRYGTERTNHLPKPYRATTSCYGWFLNVCLAQSTGPSSWPMDTRKDLALSFNTPDLIHSVHRCYDHENSFLFHWLWSKWSSLCSSGFQSSFFIQLCDFHLTFSEHYLQNRRDVIIQITKLFEWNEIFANVFLGC